jgi:hypothetical protein
MVNKKASIFTITKPTSEYLLKALILRISTRSSPQLGQVCAFGDTLALQYVQVGIVQSGLDVLT